MRHSDEKARGIACQYDRFDFEAQFAIAMSEALKEPRSEEAGTTGDEDAASARLPPQRLGLPEDVIQIFKRQRLHSPSINAGPA
jgi:hypothetical protein